MKSIHEIKKVSLTIAIFVLFISCGNKTEKSMAENLIHEISNSEKNIEVKADLLIGKALEKFKVAVLIYDGALLLDYGIAAEMFLAANGMNSFEVFTVSAKESANLSIVGKVKPNYSFENVPAADIVVVPGGMFWPQEGERPQTIEFLKKAQSNGAVLFSVCTGSLLLAKAGLLKGKEATTNNQALQMLNQIDPSIVAVRNRKYVDAGNILTSAGSGSSIEATLYLIEKFTDPAVAKDLAKRYLDYPYEINEILDPNKENE